DYYLGPASPVGLYQSGSLDVVTLGQGDIPAATDPENPLHAQLTVTPLLSLWYVGLNTQQKPFDDPKVRQAFAYATNKRLLANGVFHGAGSIANGIIPRGMPGFDETFEGIKYDPVRARSLLAESSYGGPGQLPPISLSVGPGLGAVAEGFARMYRDNLGIDVAPVVLKNSQADDLAHGRLQMFVVGWIADYPDPQDFVEILFGGGSDANYSRYNNPQLNELMSEAQNQSDSSTRNGLYAEGQRLVVADAPAIPLYFDTEYDLIQPHVKGLTITPVGIVSFDGVTITG
ncbi:MAG TPA: ABC transporter substrate-binding protein, partial [Chloroflexota bacterium]|nr:ABC transporter substrate-binding protein [Chloroflexota bacterium]